MSVMSSCCSACLLALLFLIVESSPAGNATTTTTNSTLISAAVEVTSAPPSEVAPVTAEKPSSLQKRHTYRGNRNSVDVKKNVSARSRSLLLSYPAQLSVVFLLLSSPFFLYARDKTTDVPR